MTFNTLLSRFIGGLFFFFGRSAIGYGVALFDRQVLKQELLKQVKNIASISEIIYSDGSTIASIENSLHASVDRCCSDSEGLSHCDRGWYFNEHMELYLRLLFITTLGTFWSRVVQWRFDLNAAGYQTAVGATNVENKWTTEIVDTCFRKSDEER